MVDFGAAMGKLLHRYLLREIVSPYVLGLAVFTFVLLVARLLKLVELVVNRGLPLSSVLWLLSYILPAFLEITVPMAMLLGLLVAFGRLSTDSELVAIRSAGVSLYQLVPPIAIVVFASVAATALLSCYARPWGNRSLKTAIYEIARTRAGAGLKTQVFNDMIPGLVIYTERIEPGTNRLIHILVSDERDPNEHNTIFARQGMMISDVEAQTVTLRLLRGWMHTADHVRGAEYQTEFQSFDVSLDLHAALAGERTRERSPAELTLPELRTAIATKERAGARTTPELVEFHRKFSIPFACLVFAAIAVPLGLQPARAVRSQAFATSLAVIFFYYILLSLGQALAEQEVAFPVVGLWLPNVVLGLLGAHLFHAAARESGSPVLGAVRQAGRVVRALVPSRFRAIATP